MSGNMIAGLAITIFGSIFSVFYLFWASSGKSPTFNDIMEDIARRRRRYNKEFTVKDVQAYWQVVAFIMLIAFIIGLIIVIVNKGEPLIIE